jgi:preprotein translocase subunit SecD
LTRFRASVAVMALVAAILIAIAALGSRTGPQGSATVYAAVRFEVRLAEEQPGADRRAAKVAGSDRVIYLHDEVVVTNDDIARSAVAPGGTPSTFNIGIRFNEAGAEKMRRATANHLGKPLAVLIDGEVVMAPTLRSPVSDSALISGDFSQAEAERIVNGIGGR